MTEDTLPVIEVLKVTENEDGTATIELDLDVEAVRLLLNVGLQKLLTDHMNEQEIKNDNN
tara:strand:- start:71 stop:250 length:180 start_codon:yes stop_codon:yes gene_type:complete